MATDHLAKAKDYIAKGEDYYRKAASELTILHDEGWTWAALGREVDRSEHWVRQLVADASKPTGPSGRPFGGPEENEARYERQVKQVLRDPDKRKRALSELPPSELEAVRNEATEAVVARARAERKEHDTTSTVGDLMGDDKFDPAEYWADTLVIRVNKNARELGALIKRAGGLLYGSMTPEEAFEYLHEAEGLIADARAAAQEQSRDRVEVS